MNKREQEIMDEMAKHQKRIAIETSVILIAIVVSMIVYVAWRCFG